MLPINFFLGFMSIWSLEISALILFATCLCWILRKKPGNVHAAIWVTTLILAWVVPFAPWIVPSSMKLVIKNPQIERVQIVPGAIHSKSYRPKSNSDSIQREERSTSPENRHAAASYSIPSAPRIPTTSKNPFKSTMEWIKTGLACLWFLGVLYFFLRWIRLRNHLRRILRYAEEIDESSTHAMVERVRQLLFLEGPIQVITADAVIAPFVMGLKYPILFLPSYVVKTWNPREIQAVIGHELGHLRRYDLYVHAAMQILRALFWFWPPVWWMQRELHRAQDAACDECAAVVLGSGLEFGEALTRLAQHCLIQDYAFPALGMIHSQHALIKRLENIMSQKMVRLTRVSLRYKVALFLVSFLLAGISGLFTQAVVSQTMDLKFLANYPDSTVEGFTYASPYYVVITREKGERFATYYNWNNGEWAKVQQIKQSIPCGTESPTQTTANDRYTYFLYQTSIGEVKGWAIDHQDLDRSLSANFNLPADGVFQSARVSGDSLYALIQFSKEKTGTNGIVHYRGQYIYRLTLAEDGSSVAYKMFYIPPQLSVYAFDLYGDSIAMVANYGGMEGYTKFGLMFGRMGDNAQLEVEEQRWFEGALQPGIYRYPNQFYVLGTTMIVNFKVTDTSGDSRYSEIYYIDWAQRDNPITRQIIPVASGNNLSTMWISHDPSTIGIIVSLTNPSSSSEYGMYLDLYQMVDGTYQKKSTIPHLPSQYGEIGKNTFYYETDGVYYFFDCNDITNPKAYSIPISPSASITAVAANQKYVYFTAFKNGQTKLISLDTAIPSDLRTTNEQVLSLDDSVNLAAHDSLLVAYLKKGTDRIEIFQLDSTGALGEKITAPQFPTEEGKRQLLKLLWNQTVFIALCWYRDPTQSNSHEVDAYIFVRTDTGIGSMIAKVRLMDYAMYIEGATVLNGDYLFMVTSESYIDDQSSSSKTRTNLHIYSFVDPQRPELILDYELKHPFFIMPGLGSLSANERYLCLSDALDPSLLIDIRDVMNPKEYAVESYQNVINTYWFNDLLVLKLPDSIVFCRIQEDGTLQEIGRQDVFKQTVKLSFTPNRMFVSREEDGLDIYQIQISDLTSIPNWKSY